MVVPLKAQDKIYNVQIQKTQANEQKSTIKRKTTMSRTNVVDVDKPQSLDYSVGKRNRVQFKYYCLNYVRPSPCVDCNSSLGPDEPKPTWLQTSSSRAPAGDAFVHVVLTGHASAAASMSDASTYTRDRGRRESLPFATQW